MTWPPTPRTRRWAYGICTAGLAVAGAYGILDGQQLAAWMGLAAAITGMATALTPDDADPDAPEPRRGLD